MTDTAEGGRFGAGDPVRLHFPAERLWLLPVEAGQSGDKVQGIGWTE